MSCTNKSGAILTLVAKKNKVTFNRAVKIKPSVFTLFVCRRLRDIRSLDYSIFCKRPLENLRGEEQSALSLFDGGITGSD
ncbi:uncharacterized protein PHALS_05393 [Plasmopara halstedii]|uniref:Uncharacterized protein n=1 Tax=Plasmopara halstedii TaxID=4781 RepID=A0A0P1AAP8_PLAHL|nr:uncharacterized protein PHALS_05393 [Plasmopara halstedii]CEG37614.1 hypothetical protein PHALS_05393 [Plasmopara halstedii]|eukprot:XP_024573983.1 hypothetical protein PHALS_05393 [Plasmopara halstedii]